MGEDKKRGNRWYDEHPELADQLDLLSKAEKPKQDSVVRKIIRFLLAEDPDALEKAANQKRPDHQRRWYDSSPQLWTAVNSFQFADPTSIARGIALMGDELVDEDSEGQKAPPSDKPVSGKA